MLAKILNPDVRQAVAALYIYIKKKRIVLMAVRVQAGHGFMPGRNWKTIFKMSV